MQREAIISKAIITGAQDSVEENQIWTFGNLYVVAAAAYFATPNRRPAWANLSPPPHQGPPTATAQCNHGGRCCHTLGCQQRAQQRE
jgi:hypothetical protein